MSYILDALRKSDEQRRRGATPTLQTPQPPPAPAQPKTFWMVALAVLLVGGGVLIGAFGPWQGSPPAKVAALPAAKPPVTPAAPAPSAPPPLVEAPKPVPPAASTPAPAPVVEAPKQAPVAPQAAVVPQPQPTVARSAAPAVRAERAPKTTVAAAKSSAPAPRKPDVQDKANEAARKPAAPAQPPAVPMSDLPIAVQQEMPRLAISAHAYSSVPRERLVGIEDRVLREGDEAAPGLVLEQITPDGMIMTYKGYRFRRGAR